MRRDCIAFAHRMLEATELAPGQLFQEEEPYDLGYEFFIARMGCPEFRKIDTGKVADALTRVGEQDFGEIAVELSSNSRIHYPRALPPLLQRRDESARSLWRAVRHPVALTGIVHDPDVFRSMQRGHYTRHG
jgi:hypothetical protein